MLKWRPVISRTPTGLPNIVDWWKRKKANHHAAFMKLCGVTSVARWVELSMEASNTGPQRPDVAAEPAESVYLFDKKLAKRSSLSSETPGRSRKDPAADSTRDERSTGMEQVIHAGL